MTAFLSNAFNDPSNPWYYVVGVLFLALIFGALAVYIILSNRKKKKDEEKTDGDSVTNADDATPNANANETAQDTTVDSTQKE